MSTARLAAGEASRFVYVVKCYAVRTICDAIAADELVWRGVAWTCPSGVIGGGNPPMPPTAIGAELLIRILILSNLFPPAHIGGYELRCSEVADRWQRRGHAVRVLTSRYPGDLSAANPQPQPAAVDVRRLLGIGWGPPYPCDSLVEMLRAEAADRATLSAELRSFAPDVVSVWGMEFASQPLVHALFRSNAPLHATIEDIWLLNAFERDPLCHTREMLDALAVSIPGEVRSLLNLGCERPDSRPVDISFSSDALARRYEEGGFRSAGSQVLRAGIDLKLFRDNRRWNAPARAHGPLRVLFVGLASEQRGVIDLATAAAAARQRGTLVELRIVGACAEPMRQRIRDVCGAGGVAVRFDGPLDAEAVCDAMAESDVLCAPSRLPEGLPRVLMEAMAAGLPIIATDGGAQPEIVQSEFGGQLLRPGDCDALMGAIHRAGVDRAGMRRLAAAGRAYALRDFDIDRYAERLEASLHATAERHARRGGIRRRQFDGGAADPPVAEAVLRDLALRAGRAAEATVPAAVRRADATELWRLGVLLKRSGRTGAARKVLLALVERFGSAGAALRRAALHLGELALAEGDFATAARWLRACLETTPDHARAHHDLACAESGRMPAHLMIDASEQGGARRAS